MAWTITKTVTQNGTKVLVFAKAVTDNVAGNGILVDFSADVTATVNNRTHTALKILTLGYAPLMTSITTSQYQLAFDQTTDVVITGLCKSASSFVDFRRLPSYGIPDTKGSGFTGDILINATAPNNADTFTFMMELELIP